ncbi:hypothetical protein KKA27_04105 [Patescibacteria group bacterium]|nr:hypothetical protein [Patescibacteria group bacterium]
MKKDINIKNLIVNPENYRFDPVDNQGEAINLMLEEKGAEIFNLANHIFEHGLDQAKDSRILEIKKNLFLILDGNRRATAIKCLQNPSLIKDSSLRVRFSKISKGKGSIPDEVNCFVYKNEVEAAEWIRLDHTGKNKGIGQDPWEPASKDRFDYKFGGKISPAVQIINLFEHETKHKLKTKTLKISTVNRILSNPESRSYLGIDIRNGKIILVAPKKEIIKRLDQLFNKIIADNVAVKEVYHVPDSIKFMEELFSDKPKFTKTATIVSPKGYVQKRGVQIKKSFPKSTSRKTLIPKECILEIDKDKINNIYRELRDDLLLDGSLKATPNAVGVLFRVFLEVSLDYYLSKKIGKLLPQNATINQKIDAVTKYMEKNKIADSNQLSPIRTVSSSKTKDILHIQRFHEYVHSTTIEPESSSLKTKWNNLQEFFEILWEEISKNKKQKRKT